MTGSYNQTEEVSDIMIPKNKEPHPEQNFHWATFLKFLFQVEQS